MSSGALDYSNVVIGPIRLSQKRRYYVDHSAGGGGSQPGEAHQALTSHSSIRTDSGNRRRELHVCRRDRLGGFALAAQFRCEVVLSLPAYRAGMYQITGLGLHSSDLVIGTFCHESGHMLCRFPDLYDYGKRDGDFERSAGLGVYCLMSAGNHLNGGRTPAPICAYLRYLADWCPNRVSLNEPGVRQATHGAYDTVFVYETARPTEYFLLENRGKFGLDQHLPSSGLAVYHCDTEGSNERQGGTAEQHYQCSLLQADGRLDLEQNANQGDTDDFFALIQGEALSDTTMPSTKLWDGSDSGLRIADISATDETITFLVPPRRNIMNGSGSSIDADPDALKRLQEQTKILQANLDFYKLTQQQEQERLKAEIDRVKLEADKQKAEADKIKALLPSGTTKPLSGETKTDEKFGYIAKLAANEAIGNAAKEIAFRVRSVIAGAADASYRARGHVGLLRRRYPDAPNIPADGGLETGHDRSNYGDRGVIDETGSSWKSRPARKPFIAAAALLPVLGQVLAERARDDQLGGGHRRLLPG